MKALLAILCLVTLTFAEFNKEQRIFNGKKAKPGQFPFQVALSDSDDFRPICGGSLIHPNYVLTATHCLDIKHKKYFLTFGINNYEKEEGVRREVTKFAVHSEYDPLWKHNDIALMFIEDAVPINDKIQTIQLAYLTLGGNEDTIVSGWGMLNQTGDQAVDLMYTNMKSMTYDECKEPYFPWLKEPQLCCKGENNSAACYGDSGGPLVQIKDGEAPIQVGVVSFGSNLGCEKGQPIGFTRVEMYYDWILDKMKELMEQ